jgi:hypothetical protein
MMTPAQLRSIARRADNYAVTSAIVAEADMLRH